MSSTNSQKCQEPDCKKQPVYNCEGQTKGAYCSSHKKEGMVDVKNPTCQEPGCKTRPVYNCEGQTKGAYCATHKKEGMVNVKSPTCKEPDCKKQPVYNCEGQTKGAYCATHKKDGMVNVKDPTCQEPDCTTRVSNKYDGYCLSCFVNLFPEKPNARNYKTKERSVVEFVLQEVPDKTWIADKRVTDGCSKRRPDLYLDMGSHVIITEVDENQHTDYDCSCENRRLMELSQDVGHRPIVFIRFNPDEYTKADTKVTSCWGIDKKGFCVVKKSKQKEWGHRLSCLKDQIVYWMETIPEKTVEVIQLFFDQ